MKNFLKNFVPVLLYITAAFLGSCITAPTKEATAPKTSYAIDEYFHITEAGQDMLVRVAIGPDTLLIQQINPDNNTALKSWKIERDSEVGSRGAMGCCLCPVPCQDVPPPPRSIVTYGKPLSNMSQNPLPAALNGVVLRRETQFANEPYKLKMTLTVEQGKALLDFTGEMLNESPADSTSNQ